MCGVFVMTGELSQFLRKIFLLGKLFFDLSYVLICGPLYIFFLLSNWMNDEFHLVTIRSISMNDYFRKHKTKRFESWKIKDIPYTVCLPGGNNLEISKCRQHYFIYVFGVRWKWKNTICSISHAFEGKYIDLE